LRGNEGGASVVAVFGDFEEVASLFVRQGRRPPVVQDEEVGAGQGAQEFVVASVASGDGEVLEEAGEAEVQAAVALAAGLRRTREASSMIGRRFSSQSSKSS